MINDTKFIQPTVDYNSLLVSPDVPQVPIFIGSSFKKLSTKWRGVLTNVTYSPYLRNEFVSVDTGLKAVSGSPLVEFSGWTFDASYALSLPNTLTYKFFWFKGGWRTSFLVRSSTTASELWLNGALKSNSILNGNRGSFFSKLAYTSYTHRPLLTFYGRFSLLESSTNVNFLFLLTNNIFSNYVSTADNRIFSSFNSLSSRGRFLGRSKLLVYKRNFLNFFIFDKNRRVRLWFSNNNSFDFLHLQRLLCDTTIFGFLGRFKKSIGCFFSDEASGDLSADNLVLQKNFNYDLILKNLVFNLNVLIFFFVELKFTSFFLSYLNDIFFLVFKSFAMLAQIRYSSELNLISNGGKLIFRSEIVDLLRTESNLVLKEFFRLNQNKNFSVLFIKKIFINYFLRVLPHNIGVHCGFTSPSTRAKLLTWRFRLGSMRYTYYNNLLNSTYFFLTKSGLSYFSGGKVTLNAFFSGYSKSFKWWRWRKWRKTSNLLDSKSEDYTFKKTRRTLFSKIKLPSFKRQFFFLFFWSFNFFNFFSYKKYDRGFSVLSQRLVRFFSVFKRFLIFYNFIFQILQNLLIGGFSFQKFGIFFVSNIKLYLWRLYYVFGSLLRNFSDFALKSFIIHNNYLGAKRIFSSSKHLSVLKSFGVIQNRFKTNSVLPVSNKALVRGAWKYLPLNYELTKGKRNFFFKLLGSNLKKGRVKLSFNILGKFSVSRYFGFLVKLTKNFGIFREKHFFLDKALSSDILSSLNYSIIREMPLDAVLLRFHKLFRCFNLLRVLKRSKIVLKVSSFLQLLLNKFSRILSVRGSVVAKLLRNLSYRDAGSKVTVLSPNSNAKRSKSNLDFGRSNNLALRLSTRRCLKLFRGLRVFLKKSFVAISRVNAGLLKSRAPTKGKRTSIFLNLVRSELLKIENSGNKFKSSSLTYQPNLTYTVFSKYFFNLFKVGGFERKVVLRLLRNCRLMGTFYLSKRNWSVTGFSCKINNWNLYKHLGSFSGEGLGKFNFLLNQVLSGSFWFWPNLNILGNFSNTSLFKFGHNPVLLNRSALFTLSEYYINRFLMIKKFRMLGSFSKISSRAPDINFLSFNENSTVGKLPDNLSFFFFVRSSMLVKHFKEIFVFNINFSDFKGTSLVVTSFSNLVLFSLQRRKLFNIYTFSSKIFYYFLETSILFFSNCISFLRINTFLKKKSLNFFLSKIIGIYSVLSARLRGDLNSTMSKDDLFFNYLKRVDPKFNFNNFYRYVLVALNSTKSKSKFLTNSLSVFSTLRGSVDDFFNYYATSDFEFNFARSKCGTRLSVISDFLGGFYVHSLAISEFLLDDKAFAMSHIKLIRRLNSFVVLGTELRDLTTYYQFSYFLYQKRLFSFRFFFYLNTWSRLVSRRLKKLCLSAGYSDNIRNNMINYVARFFTTTDSSLALIPLRNLSRSFFLNRINTYRSFVFKRFLNLDLRCVLGKRVNSFSSLFPLLKNCLNIKPSSCFRIFVKKFKLFYESKLISYPYHHLNSRIFVKNGGLSDFNVRMGLFFLANSFVCKKNQLMVRSLNVFSLEFLVFDNLKKIDIRYSSVFRSFFNRTSCALFWSLSYYHWVSSYLLGKLNIKPGSLPLRSRFKHKRNRFGFRRSNFFKSKHKEDNSALFKFLRKIKRFVRKRLPQQLAILKNFRHFHLKAAAVLMFSGKAHNLALGLVPIFFDLSRNYNFFRYLTFKFARANLKSAAKVSKKIIVISNLSINRIVCKARVGYCRRVLNYFSSVANFRRIRAYSENLFTFRVRTNFYAKLRQIRKLNVFVLVKKMGLVAKNRKYYEMSFGRRNKSNFDAQNPIAAKVFKPQSYFKIDSQINQDISRINHKFVYLRLTSLLRRRKKFFPRIFRKKFMLLLSRLKLRFIKQLFAVFRRKRRLKIRVRFRIVAFIFKAIFLLNKFSNSSILSTFNVSTRFLNLLSLLKLPMSNLEKNHYLSFDILRFKYVTQLYNKLCSCKQRLKSSFYLSKKYNFIGFIVVAFFKKISVFFNSFFLALSTSNCSGFFVYFYIKWLLFFLKLLLVFEFSSVVKKVNLLFDSTVFVYYPMTLAPVNCFTSGSLNLHVNFEFFLHSYLVRSFYYSNPVSFYFDNTALFNFAELFVSANNFFISKKLISVRGKKQTSVWKFFITRSANYNRFLASSGRFFLSTRRPVKKNKRYNNKRRGGAFGFTSFNAKRSNLLKKAVADKKNFVHASKLRISDFRRRMFGLLLPRRLKKKTNILGVKKRKNTIKRVKYSALFSGF